MMSEADDAFLSVHLDHLQPKSRLQDYMITSRSAIWLQIQTSCKIQTMQELGWQQRCQENVRSKTAG